MYLGEIKNWQQLGGPDLDIEVVTRDQQSGTHEVWNRIVMDQAAAVTRLPRRHYNDEMVRAVSASPGPIGYTGLGYLNARIKPL
ncbi:MAG: substrate-binding domain-containing protein [Gammaproteobacteria bacterium]|nr:MAG: hypothetical protein EP300_07995 [Gammaproteobacteria bacterium]UCH42076.1 MAG: substrate-binding domain-containing protein [Gammaproteobacteria bacterium]